jgi:flagellar hook-associated protein 1 FlgK
VINNNNVTRTADLMSIARSGVDASTQLLNTAGHNIANVNTEGYVRERTNFVSQLTGGVGRSTTERVINTFAQNQLRRDTTLESHYQEYWDKTSVVDNVFASEANSIASSMSRFFAAVQTAADDPTSIAARQLTLGEANSLVGQIGSMTSFLRDKEEELNYEIQSNIDEVNSLVKNISDLNGAIRASQANNQYDEPGTLKNERDKAVLQLASLMSIETRENTNDGSVMINLTTGESLVLQDGSFNLFTINNSADTQYKSLKLSSNGKPITINLKENNLGGTIGGLFRYRDEVLESSRRELGQLAMAVTESLNTQNRLGMDYDGQLGTDIFKLPKFAALNYSSNSSLSTVVTGRVTQGQASQLTSADYQVTFDAVTAGAPPTVDVTIAALNPDGSPIKDVNGVAITQSYSGLVAQSGTFNPILGGIELEFGSGAAYVAGDKFLVQPTKNSADKIAVSMTRPEDLAFASPLHVEASLNNLGDVKLVSTTVPNTTVDNTFANSAASAFDGAGGIHGPGSSPTGAAGVGAPAQILFTAIDEYQVLDSAGTVITTVSGVTDFTNMLAQAEASGASPAWPAAFSALDNYPGFDLSLQGVPKAGDSFTLAYNTGGLNDNRNGLAMADLQKASTVQLNTSGSGKPVSFHEAYTNIVSDIGQKAASADISLKAAEALKSQSKDWFESVSGVSLDEEAANLVRFQQSYSAAAKLLGTAQDMFNTILSIV